MQLTIITPTSLPHAYSTILPPLLGPTQPPRQDQGKLLKGPCPQPDRETIAELPLLNFVECTAKVLQ